VTIVKENVPDKQTHKKLFYYARPTIIPKSSKGFDDQPKKIKKKIKKKSKKKIKIKIKIKSPLSMHHTTQLWNFFIGHWT